MRKKIEKRKQKQTSCLLLNPAQGNKSQSLPKFLDFMMIFFILDGQFWPMPLDPAQKFTPSNSLHFYHKQSAT